MQHQYPVEDYPAVLHPQYCLNEVAKWTQKQGVTLPAVTYGCGASHSVLARPRDHPVTRLVEDRLKMTLPGLVSQIQKTANEMKADDYFSKRGDRMEEAKGFERALRSVILKTESPPKSFFSDAEMRQDTTRDALLKRGFEYASRGPNLMSLPDLVHKHENGQCVELKCSVLYRSVNGHGGSVSFGGNAYPKHFADGTFYAVWVVLLMEEDVGVVLGRSLTAQMYSPCGQLKARSAIRLEGWDGLGVFSLGGCGRYLPAFFTD